jgi:uncharacterized iron-regulated membrane protein
VRDHDDVTASRDDVVARVLGEQDAKYNLQAIARALHGELMIGTVGDRLVELAAGWGVMLVISGVYLWWPRGKSAAVRVNAASRPARAGNRTRAGSDRAR